MIHAWSIALLQSVSGLLSTFLVHSTLLMLSSTLLASLDVAVSAGNEMDLTMVNLDDVLPQATIMVVSVTASTTSGQPLSPENLQKVLDAAAVALQLDEDKIQILQLVQQKMHKIAPNLSTAVGTEVAARLMGVAGGLINLSKMPACNVQVLLQSYTVPTFLYRSCVLQ